MNLINKDYAAQAYKETKKNQLKQLAQSVLSNPAYKTELKLISKRFNVSQEEIVDAYISYDLDISTFDNAVYSPLVMRFVLHLHNLLEGSWHIDRQKSILTFLKQINPHSIIDLGFGVPTQYIRWFLSHDNTQLTLCDISENAVFFAKSLLEAWGHNWENKIDFITSDMSLLAQKPTNYECYLFQDSIEHVGNPTECLINFVQHSPKNAYFLLSLPIGPKIPMHTIAWETLKEADVWIEKCGLKLLAYNKVRTNPEVDLFASEVSEGFLNYIVLCNKKGSL